MNILYSSDTFIKQKKQKPRKPNELLIDNDAENQKAMMQVTHLLQEINILETGNDGRNHPMNHEDQTKFSITTPVAA